MGGKLSRLAQLPRHERHPVLFAEDPPGRFTGAVVQPSDPEGPLATYNPAMHIVVIAWLYVTVLMALTEASIVAGILTLMFYGLLPTALLLWLFGGPGRRRRAARKASETAAGKDGSGDESPRP